MATNPAQPPVDPTKPAADAKYDELSGVYGFFRRHQKTLLYTAGLFTLLTFSISVPMMSFFDDVFRTPREMPTLLVNGQRVPLHEEDDQYGNLLEKNWRAVPPGVLPMLDPGEKAGGQLGEVFAILRRAAIAEGIDVSMIEVDRAIETLRAQAGTESAARLASNMSFASLAQYRNIVKEAMRIGTYVRLQTLGLNGSDARVLEQALADREKITLKVATLDEKVLEEQLKTAGALSEEDLRKWLDGKSDPEKRMIGAFDEARAKLRIGALLTAEGQFDPEQWKDEFLKDFTVGDDVLGKRYEQEKATRFVVKVEGKADEFKPLDDAAVKAELTRLIQAEEVMKGLLGKIRQKLDETTKAPTEEAVRLQGELGAAQNKVREAEAKVPAKADELAAKKTELEQKPDDAALKEQVATLATELETANTELEAAKTAVTEKTDASTKAQQAAKDARAGFDFPAAFAEVTKDKRGFVQKDMPEARTAADMKDLSALELGKWEMSFAGVNFRDKGDLCFQPATTSAAVMIFQAADLELMPPKPWDKLKPLAEGAYWTEMAKKQAADKKKLMEDALLRLAKGKIATEVAELEGKKQARVDEQLAAWQQKTEEQIAAAEKELARLPAGSQMRAIWQSDLDAKKKMLEQKDQQRTLIDANVAKEIEGEVATAAKKHYHEVLAEAAAEAGFTVTDLKPQLRDLRERDPRFEQNPDKTLVFLFRSQSQLKENETTAVLNDPTNRRYHVAACTKVEPLTAADLTRRDFESLRTGDGQQDFASQQAFYSYAQAFTVKALEVRYDVQRPRGEQREQAAVDPNDPK